jgi:hypothetical protein
MRKRIFTILLAMAFGGGAFGLLKILPLGLSSNAYATPDKGENCSKCHGSKAKGIAKGFKGFTSQFMTETCGGFSSEGTNPYFVLTPGFQLTLEGREKKENVHLTITVLDETKTFNNLNMGGEELTDVTTRVVEERETRDGLLAEVSRNYFAICNRTNSVFYFGEDVDIYDETGKTVVSHDGSWLAGQNDARAGIIMPGVILLGGKYFQEVAPDVALDRAEILSMTEAIQTPAGPFANCLKTEETSVLERGKTYKFYGPGIGLIRDGTLELTQYGTVP